MMLLPDTVLQEQVCSECYKYLSVAPISITTSGDKVCGRCLPDLKKSGLKYGTSLFSTAVEDVLFKCVNHLDGCNKTLTIHNTVEHEKVCVSSRRSCFFCSFSGNWHQIINHCRAIHPDQIPKDAQFTIQLDKEPSERKYVFLVNHTNIIVVSVKKTESKITYVVSSENGLCGDIILYSFTFFSLPDKELFFSEFNFLDLGTKNYFEKDIDTLISYFGENQEICLGFKPVTLDDQEQQLLKSLQDIKMQKEYLIKKESDLNKLEKSFSENSEMITLTRTILKIIASTWFICQSCYKICDENSYFCPKKHCYCKRCLNSWCNQCATQCNFSELPKDFAKLKVQCDWPECLKFVQISEYLKHTQKECNFRPIRCPLRNCNTLVYSIPG